MENIKCHQMAGYMVSTSLQISEIKTSYIHSLFEKSVIERTVQYFKDRTESFDDYFPCTKKKRCKLDHVIN